MLVVVSLLSPLLVFGCMQKRIDTHFGGRGVFYRSKSKEEMKKMIITCIETKKMVVEREETMRVRSGKYHQLEEPSLCRGKNKIWECQWNTL